LFLFGQEEVQSGEKMVVTFADGSSMALVERYTTCVAWIRVLMPTT